VGTTALLTRSYGMDLDAMEAEPAAVSVGGVPLTTTLPTILCCTCGSAIAAAERNPSNMCLACLRGRIDITESVPKQASIYYCKGCARYLSAARQWVACELESKELLSLCIKRLKGLSKVKLIDAGFRWTEPHSRRIHVRLLVQKEVFNGTILQQEFIVEFVVEYQQCDMCRRDAADMDQWTAVVQARQKVPHKRTFLYLEQLILKHNAHEDALGIKMHPDGLDFYFFSKSQALKFVSFLHHVVPMRHKTSDHLVSHDANSNEYRYNYTFSSEIVPICKDDVVCLPAKLATQLGGVGPLVLVTRISQAFSVLDPSTLRTVDVAASTYWKMPFAPLMTSRQLVEFVVLDIDLTGEEAGRYAMADATVARVSDYGQNDITYLIRTHLGRFLHPGDLALGYDLQNAVYNDALVAGHKKALEFPDIVLTKKTYSKRDRAKKRAWRLARLNMEMDDGASAAGGAPGRGGRVLDPAAREAAEREEFLQELEQDQDLRAAINLYKAPARMAAVSATGDASGAVAGGEAEDEADDEEYPEVPIEELLEGLDLGGDGEATAPPPVE
jgi:nonsense-mediated mRNA decay protein 3